MEKVVVVDIDETLLISNIFCRLLRRVAQILFKLSLYFQTPNKQLIKALKNYDRVVVVTARGENYRGFTEKQLKRHGVVFHQLIMYQYSRQIFLWKKDIVSKVNPIKWIDDIKASAKEFGVEGYT